MKELIVTLTTTELMIAGYVGSGRNVQAITRKWDSRDAPPENMWNYNIEGAAGEMAVAKALDLYWEPVIGNPKADDAGPYQVRTNISRKHQDLCLRHRDADGKIFISVLSFLPRFEILGWILSTDGKQQQYLRAGDPSRPDCYYVPRGALHDMSELPRP